MAFEPSLSKKLVAEVLGTMGLVLAVTGALTYAGTGWEGILLAGLGAGFVLFAMIESFGKISGGHFNPAVSIAMIVSKDIDAKTGILYMIAQIIGGVVAVLIVIVTFLKGDFSSYGILESSSDGILYFAISEFVCVFMLVAVIYCLVRSGSKKVSLAVGATVGGLILVTASHFVANPAMDVGLLLVSVLNPIEAVVGIVVALVAGVVASLVLSWLFPKEQAA